MLSNSDSPSDFLIPSHLPPDRDGYVGVAIGGIEDQFYMPQRVLVGLVRGLSRQGRMTQLFNGDPLTVATDRDILLRRLRQYTAIVVPMTVQPSSTLTDILEAAGCPVLWMFLRQPINALLLDEADAGRRLMQHLYEQNHRHVIYLDFNGGSMPAAHTTERIRGARIAAQEFQMQFTTMTDRRVARSERFLFIRQWLETLEKPAAVIVDSASAAHVVLNTAHLMNIEVPGQLAIATFDEGSMLNICAPTMTGAVSPMWELGLVAADMIDHMLAAPDHRIESRLAKFSIWPGGTTVKAIAD